MLVSAIIVSLILMSTATTMSQLKQQSYTPMDQGYDLNMIHNLGQNLDLAKKSNREKFKNALAYQTSYTTQLTYWEPKRCYNITLSNTRSELRLNCVGNGSVFNDGFEDGEYRDPAWIKTNDYGEANVKTIYAPNSGNKALQLSESRDAAYTSYKMMWERTTDVWNQPWKASGLFYTGELDNSVSQRQQVVLYLNETRTEVLKVSMGFTDSSGNNIPFKIKTVGLINSRSRETTVNWRENTWYRWQVVYKGSGQYTGRIWREGQDKPANPSTKASGEVPTGLGVGGFQMNGSAGRPFTVSHAYFKLEKR
ncbi:MAG: hypothetical protein ABEK04_00430 [Candidatus Nanohalobium sp.]